jgi:hypothetical protein
MVECLEGISQCKSSDEFSTEGVSYVRGLFDKSEFEYRHAFSKSGLIRGLRAARSIQEGYRSDLVSGNKKAITPGVKALLDANIGDDLEFLTGFLAGGLCLDCTRAGFFRFHKSFKPSKISLPAKDKQDPNCRLIHHKGEPVPAPFCAKLRIDGLVNGIFQPSKALKDLEMPLDEDSDDSDESGDEDEDNTDGNGANEAAAT